MNFFNVYRFALVVIVIVVIASLINYNNTKNIHNHIINVAAMNGVMDAQIDGYALVGCSENDIYRYKVSGEDAYSNHVDAIVCCDWYEICHVRWR